MATKRTQRIPKEPETPLQALFVKRVKEELEARGLTVNALCGRVGGPKQKTLDDAIYGGAVPRLTLVHQTAVALEMQPFQLLRESDRQVRRRGDVVPLRTHQSILRKPDSELRKSLTYKSGRRK